MTTQSTVVKRKELIERLRRSRVFKEYAEAFRQTTGLPLALRSVDSLSMSLSDDSKRNKFCALLSSSRQACAACLFQQKAVDDAADKGPATLVCFAGLSDSAVPLKMGEEVVGFLVTGQVFLERPKEEAFAKLQPMLRDLDGKITHEELRDAYMQSRFIPAKQYASVLRLISIFADYLSTLSNQIMVKADVSDPPAIAHAKEFIREQAGSDIGLSDVAKSVNLSPYYFCKTFRKVTGQTFTEYLARTRIESVKAALENPHTRVSEAAFAAGFQSLSQFNRVFLRIAGESPTAYRDRILGPASATLHAA